MMSISGLTEIEAAAALMKMRYGREYKIPQSVAQMLNSARITVKMDVIKVTSSPPKQPLDAVGPASAPQIISLADGACIIRKNVCKSSEAPKKSLFIRYKEEKRLWDEQSKAANERLESEKLKKERDAKVAEYETLIKQLKEQLKQKLSSVQENEPTWSSKEENCGQQAELTSSNDEERFFENLPEPKDDTSFTTAIGPGRTLIPTRLLKQINWSSVSCATRKLLGAVFPRRMLATHSLTGKKSPAFQEKIAKKKLDPVRVNDIIETVTERCKVSANEVRKIITTKCADEAKMLRSRQKHKKIRSALDRQSPE